MYSRKGYIGLKPRVGPRGAQGGGWPLSPIEEKGPRACPLLRGLAAREVAASMPQRYVDGLSSVTTRTLGVRLEFGLELELAE